MLNDLVPLVVPLAFFWAITTVAKLIAETRTRRRLIEKNATAEFATAVMTETRGDLALDDSLKWGLVIGAVGVALIVVQFLPYRFEDPIALGVILVFGAAGLLGYYAAVRRMTRQNA
jgi:phosphatidylglycerophosphate synthase